MSGLLFWDREVFLALNSKCSSPIADVVLGLLNQLGNGWVVAALLVPLILLYDRAHGKRRVLALALSVALAGLCVNLCKPLIGRERPISQFKRLLSAPAGFDEPVIAAWIPWTKKAYPINIEMITREGLEYKGLVAKAIYRFDAGLGRDNSFPSGHAATACGAFLGLWFIYRRRPFTCLILALGASGARVYVGAHFPLDVIAGGLMGGAITVSALALSKPLWLGRAPERPRPLLAFSVGEASADAYAGGLLERLKASRPALTAFGMGGESLEKAGMERVVDSKDLSIVGFTQVIAGAGRIKRAFWRMVKGLDSRRPDLLVLIDLPDFNLMLARQARRLGIKVLYFIPPQVWAWRRGRAAKVARRADALAVIFPFERELYGGRRAVVHFVGHPLAEVARPGASREEFMREHGLDQAKRLVAVLPGSRRSEIDHLLMPMIRACELLDDKFKDLQFVVSIAPSVDPGWIEQAVKESKIRPALIRGGLYDLLGSADVGLIASGTATLEAALCGLPMVIAYRGNRLNYALGKRLVKIDRIGLPNIISKRDLAIELIQDDAKAERIADEASKFLADPGLAGNRRQELLSLRESLVGGDVIGRVAKIADEIMGKN